MGSQKTSTILLYKFHTIGLSRFSSKKIIFKTIILIFGLKNILFLTALNQNVFKIHMRKSFEYGHHNASVYWISFASISNSTTLITLMYNVARLIVICGLCYSASLYAFVVLCFSFGNIVIQNIEIRKLAIVNLSFSAITLLKLFWLPK